MPKYRVPYGLLGAVVVEADSVSDAIDIVRGTHPSKRGVSDKELIEGITKSGYGGDFDIDADAIEIYENSIVLEEKERIYSYEATIRVIDYKKIKEIADSYYDGDIELAIKGEMSWLTNSGLGAEIITKEGDS